jgi:acyl-CoA dehydrogenase
LDFEFSDKTKDFQQRLTAFMEAHIYPNEQRYFDEIERARWSPPPIVEELKPKARAEVCGTCFCLMTNAARD